MDSPVPTVLGLARHGGLVTVPGGDGSPSTSTSPDRVNPHLNSLVAPYALASALSMLSSMGGANRRESSKSPNAKTAGGPDSYVECPHPRHCRHPPDEPTLHHSPDLLMFEHVFDRIRVCPLPSHSPSRHRRPMRRPRGELLDCATEALRTRRLAEVAELKLAIEWAILHAHPRDDRDPMITPGGDGTPAVREHAIPELAMARETHPATTRALLADALDLVHRLPRTWAIVQAGSCEPWVARKVTVLCPCPDSPSRSHGSTAPSPRRSPATHPRPSSRSPAPRSSRPTPRRTAPNASAPATSATSASPAPTSTATATSSPASPPATPPGSTPWSTGSPTSSPPRMGHDHNHDELRSLAMGWLARPVELLRLLVEHTQRGTDAENRRPDAARPGHRTTWPRRSSGSARCPPASSPGSAVADGSSSTSPTRHCAPAPASPGSRASAPSTSPSSTKSSATPTSPSPRSSTCGMRRRSRRLRAPRGRQGPRLEPDRRRLLPVHPTIRDPRHGRLRPRGAVRRHRPARPDRTPQLRPATAADTTAPRPTVASPPESSAPAAISGEPRTARPSSSTTPAPRG